MMYDTKIKITYDKSRDVAYSSFIGFSPVGVYAHEEEPCVLIYRDVDNDDIVGMSVMSIKKHPDIWRQSMKKLGYEELVSSFEEAFNS